MYSQAWTRKPFPRPPMQLACPGGVLLSASARHQPVDWHRGARRPLRAPRRKTSPSCWTLAPVVHWCHVMDRESYENPEIAAYQPALCAIRWTATSDPTWTRATSLRCRHSGQGGWPLTASLTPTAALSFGGTYFSGHDRYGRPALGVLSTMAVPGAIGARKRWIRREASWPP